MTSSKIKNNVLITILAHGIVSDLNSKNTWDEGFRFLIRKFLIF